MKTLPFQLALLFVLFGAWGSCEKEKSKAETATEPIGFRIDTFSVKENPAEGISLILKVASNLPEQTMVVVEMGDATNTTTRPLRSQSQTIAVSQGGFPVVVPDSLFPAYLQFRIEEEHLASAQVKSIRKRLPKDLPLPLVEDSSCLFQSIYLMGYNSPDGSVYIEQDFTGARP